MKIQFSIQKGKESEKEGMFKKREVDNYTLNASFIPSEEERKVYLDHPLFKNLVFMKYNELDKWSTGVIFKDKHSEDRVKNISVESIFSSSNYQFKAYSIPRILELRKLVIEAGKTFVQTVEVLKKLEGSEDIVITSKELSDEVF